MAAPVARHKTAITRTALSRPVQTAITDGLLDPADDLFDYGCGLGDDLRLLKRQGYRASGWDPVHRPDAARRRAAVVNLGYVVNVIEDPEERAAALRSAWGLTDNVLVVGARLILDARLKSAARDYADGCLTCRNTFQKFYEQQELKRWIDAELGAASVAAAPGMFYVFRNEQAREAFAASRFRRRIALPRTSRLTALAEDNREALAPIVAFVEERGRPPAAEELGDTAAAAIEVFGSVRRAIQAVKRVSDTAQWAAIEEQRAQDLLLYIALARFEGRPAFTKLPPVLQRDVKAFFGTYKRACSAADEALYALGQAGAIETACQLSPLGKLTPSALYIHASALADLSPPLRLFEGCARAYIGRVEGANLIKLHRAEPMVSYLSYPEFESDPHPALVFSMSVHLQTFRVKHRDYSASSNPPILHRKETFVAPDHKDHAKFARLTRLEEQKGLYADVSRIGLRDGWRQVLDGNGLTLRGHRLLSAPDQ